MIIYFIVIFLLYMVNPVSRYGYATDGLLEERTYWQKKKRYFWFATIVLIIVIGLRDSSVGTDIANYKRLYEGVRYANFPDFYMEEEKGFFLLVWLFRKYKLSWQWFILFCSIVTVLSWNILFYKYSEDQFLCNYLNIGLGIFAFCLTGVRQTLAISLTLFSMIFIDKKKPIPFVLLVLLAYTFHNSAIVFLIAYPISLVEKFVNTRKKVWLIYVITLLTYFLKGVFARYVSVLSPARYLDGTYTLFSTSSNLSPINIIYIAGLLFVVALFWQDRTVENGEDHRIYNIMYLLGCCSVVFTILSYSSTQIGRLSLYFHLYIVIALVNGISRINDIRNRQTCRIICMFVILLAIVISFPNSATDIDDYVFFFMR